MRLDALTSRYSAANTLVAGELVALFVFTLLLLYKHRRDGAGLRALLIFEAIYFAALAAAQFTDAGRPILAVGFAQPGSLYTRLVNFNVTFFLRRELEPVLLILIVSLALNRRFAFSSRGHCLFFNALFFLICLIAFEAAAMDRGFATWLSASGLQALAVAAHFLLTQTFLVAAIMAFALEALSIERDANEYRTAAGRLALCTMLCLYLLPALNLVRPQRPVIAGAHYYSWFPENWVAGFAGEKFSPPVEPKLGRYDSGSSTVFKQHVEWMTQAGINLTIFDFWTANPAVRKRIEKQITELPDDGPMHFALQYETLDIRKKGDTEYAGETDNIVYFSSERVERMARQWQRLVVNFMKKPSYLRIDGKPVLFLYATRHLVGPVAEGMELARRMVEEETGEKLYLVGDEVYFNVIGYSKKGESLLLPELSPNWQRLSAFDAITCYNPYDSSRQEHAGSRGVSTYLRDVADLYRQYRRYAITAGIDFIPGVLPGYNDRGVRLAENHFVIPRTAGDVDVFQKSLQKLIKPFLKTSRPFFTITSWNEWNEGTQIEPSTESGRTEQDQTGVATYTQGETYSGYGDSYLQTLNAFLRDR